MKKNVLYIALVCFLLFALGLALLDENWLVSGLALIALGAALFWQRELTSY